MTLVNRRVYRAVVHELVKCIADAASVATDCASNCGDVNAVIVSGLVHDELHDAPLNRWEMRELVVRGSLPRLRRVRRGGRWVRVGCRCCCGRLARACWLKMIAWQQWEECDVYSEREQDKNTQESEERARTGPRLKMRVT